MEARPVYGRENYIRAQEFLAFMHRHRQILYYNEMHELRHLALRGHLNAAWNRMYDLLEKRSGPFGQDITETVSLLRG